MNLNTIVKVFIVLLIVAVVLVIPTALAYFIYWVLVKLGAAKWVAAAIAISLWVVMGIGANRAKS